MRKKSIVQRQEKCPRIGLLWRKLDKIQHKWIAVWLIAQKHEKMAAQNRSFRIKKQK